MLSDRFTIRRALPGDEKMLSLLGCAAFLQSYAGFLDAADIAAYCSTEHSVEVYARYLAAEHVRVYTAAAEPGNALIGYAIGCPLGFALEGATPADYELKRLYVLHRYHGRGAGRALLEQVVHAACELGYTRLLLGVNEQNATAIHFYTRHGFLRVNKRSFQVGERQCTDDVMALSL
jgi:diamine N-acetyltransferase